MPCLKARIPSPGLGLVLMLIGTLLAIFVAWGGIANRWSGGTDSANTLVVAKNLLSGRGFTVDHLMYYAPAFPSISHPENAYPLLHPALVAALGFATRDVFVAAHLLQAIFVFLYFGLLPWLALRRFGPAAAVALAVTVLALEQHTFFDRPLNDSGAMVLFALAAFEGAHAVQLELGSPQRRAWLRATLLFALAAAFKSSTIFVTLGWLGGATVFGNAPRKVQLRRVLWVLAAIALAELPVLLWYYSAHGSFGLPQGAAIRNFVRSIPPGADLWAAWERSRTYYPAHPELPTSLVDLVRQQGLLRTLVVNPALRMAYGGYHAYIRGDVYRLSWVILLCFSALLPRPRCNARLAFASMLGALLIPAYSHYEERYLYLLRPLMAFVVMEAVWRVSREASPALKRRAAVWGGVGYVALIALGMAGVGTGVPKGFDLFCLLGLGLFLIFRFTRVRSIAKTLAAEHLSRAIAVTLLAMFASRIPGSARVFFDIVKPRVEPDAVIGRFIARHVPETEAVMSRRRGLSLFSERSTVITPYHTADVCRAARRYHVRWLLITPEDRERQPSLLELTRGLQPAARERNLLLYRLRCGPSDR